MADSPAPPPSYTVTNKVAIITGAGSGINLSFATLLLSNNCSVLIADLALRPEAQALLQRYEKGAPRAVFVRTDVTCWAQLDAVFEDAVKEFGDIDIVCPGAGIFDPHTSNFWHPPGCPPSADSPTSNSYTSLDINLTHPIRTTQLALKYFLHPPHTIEPASPRNPKRVLLVSSVAGQIPSLIAPLYVAAKHGINGFVRSLAPLENHLGIRVNGVAPGLIKTPLWTENPEKMALVDEERDVWASPEEVAQAMLRCLEEEGLCGGTILEVGSGRTRVVEALGDRGPSGKGYTVSRVGVGEEEVWRWLGEEGWGRVGG